ncbi:MAG: U32 family peptidase [Desulfatibacillaceae bacterium]
METNRPEILAPAGDTRSFLAALAAGADAVYLGLKAFSARMAATNFSLSELAAMVGLAGERGTRVYVAMNVLAKPHEARDAGRLVHKLARDVSPAALIMSDPGLVRLARQAGWRGEVHLSTLANVSHPAALKMARDQLAVDRVILPRELSIDEIHACADACPPGLTLEVFVHGALCYGVSGRCYWSSYLGGKSGLRGRCVQPCRRRYSAGGGPALRYFSCQDLSLDVLVKTLASRPEVAGWKIEGRKKGPHYVYHVARAYRLLRDGAGDPEAKKEALELLEMALGRPATHYGFLPQRPFVPIRPGEPTASGKPAGRVVAEKGRKPAIRASEPLYPQDLLRVGTEDEPGHLTVPVRRPVGRGKTLALPAKVGRLPPKDTPVFLVDRRDPKVVKQVEELARDLAAIPAKTVEASNFEPREPKPARVRGRPVDMNVYRGFPVPKSGGEPAVWLSPATVSGAPKNMASRAWWWLPPVVWPDEEQEFAALVERARGLGAKKFVANAPWQAALLPPGRGLVLWAGPFCNVANHHAAEVLRGMGFDGVVISPELPGDEALTLCEVSPLPTGVVLTGLWPLCVSRTMAEETPKQAPLESPMKEVLWTRRYGQNHWIYPGWPLDLSAHRGDLARAGCVLFVHLHEPVPKSVPAANRTSEFNWKLRLL